MLVCEELFLLLTTDEGRTEGWGTQKPWGLAGAVIADLLIAGRLELSADKNPRLLVRSRDPLGHPALDAALIRLGDLHGRRLVSVVQDRRLNPVESIASTLAAAGVIRIEAKRALGLVPARYPVRDRAPEREVRRRLRGVLAGTARPDHRDAALLSIVLGLGVAARVFAEEKGTLSNRELTRRIKVASASAEGTAVAKVVEQLNAAVIAAAFVPVIASGS